MDRTPMPVLWHIEISHYNEKARWALDWKGVPHIRRTPQPGLHQRRARRLSGAATLPVLELEGAAIGDSSRIIAALEARFPEPPLYPADSAARDRALALEDFFDEHVAPNVRRLVFFYLLRDPSAPATLAEISHAGRVRARAVKLAMPLIRRNAASRYGVDRERAEAGVGMIREGLARIEAETGPEGHLVGGAFSVADLTAAALLAPLVRPPEFPYRLPGYPAPLRDLIGELDGEAFAWVRRMYAQHRPPSAEVQAS